MILLTGATGNVGGALLAQLASRGTPVRALVRSQERADNLRGFDVDIAVGTYEDPGALQAAVRGVERVFLLSPPSERMAAQEIAVLEAAAGAETPPRVVKLAAAGVDAPDEPPVRFLREHRAVVARMAELGLRGTVLAPSGFFQNFLHSAAVVQETGTLPGHGGGGAVGYVDVRDVAAVAAHVLTSDGHDGATYTVTGPEALTLPQVAARLSTLLGREVSYVEADREATRQALLAGGMSPWLADGMLELFAVYQAGAAAGLTDEVHKATGRPPRGLEEFLADHASAFR